MFLGVLVTAYLLRDRWLVPRLVALLRERAAAEGLELSIARVESDLVSGLRLEGVGVRRVTGASPFVLLENGRLEARFVVWRLLAGRPGGLTEIRVAADELRLDLDAPRAPDDGAPEPRGPRLPDAWPSIALDVGHLVLELSSSLSLTVSALSADLRFAGAETEALAVRCDGFRFEGLAQRSLEGALTGDALVRGAKLADVELAIDLGAASEPRRRALELKAGAIDLTELPDGGVSWRGTLSLLGGGGQSEGSWSDAGLALALGLEGVDLGSPALPAEWRVPRALHGSLGLQLSGTLPAGRPAAAQARFELHFERPSSDSATPGTLAAEGLLEQGQLVLARVELDAGANRLRATDLGGPLSFEEPWTWLREAHGEFRLEARDVPGLVGVRLSDAESSAVTPHEVRLAASLSGNALTLTAGEIETPGGRLFLRRGALLLPADLARFPVEAGLDVDLEVDFRELRSLGALVGAELAGRLAGGLHLQGPLADLGGEIALEATGLELGGKDLGAGTIRARAEGGVLRFEELALTSPAGELAARGALDLASRELADVVLDLALRDAAALVDARTLAGPLELHAQLSGPFREPRGPVRVAGQGLSVFGRRVRALELEGALEGRAARVERLHVAESEAELTAAGSVAWPRAADPASWRVEFELEMLALARGDEDLQLRAPVRAALGPDVVEVAPFQLAGALGRLSGEFRRRAGELELGLELEDLSFDPLLGTYLPAGSAGRATGRITLAHGAARSSASIELALEHCRWTAEGPRCRLELSAELAEGELALERLRYEGGDGSRVEASGRAPFALAAPWPPPAGPLALELAADVEDLRRLPLASGVLPGGPLRLEARLAGTTAAPAGTLDLTSAGLLLAPPDQHDLFGPLAVRLALEVGERLVISEGALRGAEGLSADLSGTCDLQPDLTQPPPALAQAFLDAPLDLQVSLDVPEMASFTLPLAAVRRFGGRLSGALELRGTPRAPLPTGKLALSEGNVRPVQDLPVFENLTGELALEEDRVLRLALAGEMGGAPVRARGELRRGDAGPFLVLDLEGEDVLLQRTADLRLRADAALHVEGPVERLVTTGELRFSSSRYTRNVDFLGSLFGGGDVPQRTGRGLDFHLSSDPPLADMQLDVTLRSKEPLRVDNNLAKAELRPELRLTGTGEVPILLGKIYVDAARLSLPSGRLELQGGLIEFREEDPFVPVIELLGEMRIRGYDIRAYASGPYDAPEIELSSSPALPNDALLVLFLTGELPSTSGTAGGLDAARSVGVYLAKDFATRWFAGSDDSDRESFLERLELDFGADLTRSGAATAEATYYLGTRRRTKTGRLPYLTAERDVYDKINFGFGLLFRFD